MQANSLLRALPLLLLAVALRPAPAHAQQPAGQTTSEGKSYGAPVTAAGAVPMHALATALGTRDSVRVKLTGPIASVCQAEGCWLTLRTAEGKPIRVRFKDHAFFVPKDISGKTVVVDGWAHHERVSVAALRHYAADAGKSKKEIAAITQPEDQLSFEADGVLVRD